MAKHRLLDANRAHKQGHRVYMRAHRGSDGKPYLVYHFWLMNRPAWAIPPNLYLPAVVYGSAPHVRQG